MVAVLNGIYSIAPGTPYLGVVLDAIRASEAIFVGEIAVTSYPRMTLPRIYYAGPLGASEVDGTGFGYQLRVSASYDRFLGTAITLTPAVAFRHDAQGITPSGNAAFNEGLMQVGLSLEANWQQRWVGTVSYFNSFGAGMRNGSNDRDFVGLSLSYSF